VKNFKSDKHYPLADATKKIHADAGWTLVKVVAMTGSARPGAGAGPSASASEAGASEAGPGPSASAAGTGPSAKKKLSEEETFCFKKL
jgi:hypothetical protein